MSTYILSDLDDTLFSSARTHGMQCAQWSIASYSKAGKPICFYSPQQEALVHHIQRMGMLIPVTGRSSESLKRVVGLKLSSYRIVSHGAMILDAEGKVFQPWLKDLNVDFEFWSHKLKQTEMYLYDYAKKHGLELRIQQVQEDQLPTYLSVKGEEAILSRLSEVFAEDWKDGMIHHNHRNLAYLPPYASKANAVQYLMNHLKSLHTEPLLFIGLGDSISDLPFLKLCDFSITPTQSHIYRKHWHE